MDFMAKNGICGITQTVPAGMSPGSDTANLSVFGYDLLCIILVELP